MPKELKERILTGSWDEKISFEPISLTHRRAEFTVCLRYNTRLAQPLITQAWITPMQQPNATEFFVLKECFANSFGAGSFDNLDRPSIWLTGWCKEHKGPFMHIYVPIESHKFVVISGSTLRLEFMR